MIRFFFTLVIALILMSPTFAWADTDLKATGMTLFILWGMVIAVTCNAFLSMLIKLVVVRSIAGGPDEPVDGFIKAAIFEAVAWLALIFFIIIGSKIGWLSSISGIYRMLPVLVCVALAWLINRRLIERNQAGALTGVKFISATILTITTPVLLFIFQFGLTRFLTSSTT